MPLLETAGSPKVPDYAIFLGECEMLSHNIVTVLCSSIGNRRNPETVPRFLSIVVAFEIRSFLT